MADVAYNCPWCGCKTAKRGMYGDSGIFVHKCTRCRKLNELEIKAHINPVSYLVSAKKGGK